MTEFEDIPLKQSIDQPRMRMFKPQLMKHELMCELELETQLPFKSAFMGIIFFCNRWGCFRWQPIRLKAEIFPHLPGLDFKAILDRFLKVGMIIKYEYKGQFYGCIPTWTKHQRIPESEPETDRPCLDPRTGKIFFESDRRPLKPSPVSSEGASQNPRPLEGVLLPLDVAAPLEQSESEALIFATDEAQGALVAFAPSALGKEGKGKGWGGRGRGSGSGSGSGRGRGSRSLSITGCAPHTHRAAIEQVFEHWKAVMNYPDAQLDPKRQKLIQQALNWGYSLGALCEAIEGCRLTPHNQGHNDRGEKYDGLNIILRSADQIDRFRRNYRCPPRMLDKTELQRQADRQSVQDWVHRKLLGDSDARH